MDGEWGVKNDGADRASRRFPTQAAAISWGRKQSAKNRSELVIHGRDGTIRDKDSFGRDPHPPARKK
jgi:hypothetical protein